jgi:hypothetical protein
MRVSRAKDTTEDMVNDLQAFSDKYQMKIEVELTGLSPSDLKQPVKIPEGNLSQKGFKFTFEPKEKDSKNDLSQLVFPYDD